MFRGQHKLVAVTLNMESFGKALDKTLEEGMKQAIRAWLRAILLRVPAWAGTARGTLLSLGSVLRVAVPITPVVFGLPGRGPSYGPLYSDYSIESTPGRYSFTFNQRLPYWDLDDLNHVPNIPSSPWGAFPAAQIEFQHVIREKLRSKKLLPQVTYRRI